MDFFQQYFIEPIETGTGYNIFNTAVYAIILILSLFVLIKVLKRLGVKLDGGLWTDLLPWIVLAGILRALEDIAFFPHTWLLITPGIYLLIFAGAFASLLIQRYTERPVVRYLGISFLTLFGLVTLFNAKNWASLAFTLALALACFLVTFYALKIFKIKILKGKNWQVLLAHTLDSSATFMALTYLCVGSSRYFEQHVLPSVLLAGLGNWVFIPLKIAVVLLALWVIDRETDREWNWMLKFTILALGLGPGTRDLMTAFMNSAFC